MKKKKNKNLHGGHIGPSTRWSGLTGQKSSGSRIRNNADRNSRGIANREGGCERTVVPNQFANNSKFTGGEPRHFAG
ncbi:hypothetical protein WN55_00204 [Dufourea novaeangliae]|uniref:Uncharacterized protein n=1 Tax=Dufourea novaeangliae TaxID=178035 RepID=A0A154PCG0_DUFNO|nr:hypothetical protein WN55_00204 [Dufourea novaeangliae]